MSSRVLEGAEKCSDPTRARAREGWRPEWRPPKPRKTPRKAAVKRKPQDVSEAIVLAERAIIQPLELPSDPQMRQDMIRVLYEVALYSDWAPSRVAAATRLLEALDRKEEAGQQATDPLAAYRRKQETRETRILAMSDDELRTALAEAERNSGTPP